MKFPWQKDSLAKMNEEKIEAFVASLEATFATNDRKLERLEKDRKEILQKAKGADPLRKQVLREKYKDNRNDMADATQTYLNQMAIWKIAKEVRRIKKRAENMGQESVIKELQKITGMNTTQIAHALDTHDIKGKIAMATWKDLANDIDQRGIRAVEGAMQNTPDTEFDHVVARLEASDEIADPAAVINQATKEFEAKQQTTSATDKM